MSHTESTFSTSITSGLLQLPLAITELVVPAPLLALDAAPPAPPCWLRP
jgi:hypothetical protein